MMKRFLKSLSRSSRTVHEEPPEEEVDEGCCAEGTGGAWVSLTVWRKSLCVGCNGFTVINSDGDLVYRVDNYPGYNNQILLMDGLGNSILTISRRKLKLGLVDNWLVYEGEDEEEDDYTTTTPSKPKNKPIYCARKYVTNILQPKTGILARVYRDKSHTSIPYVVEGSYEHRSCKVYDESRKLVVEISKKEALLEGVPISFGLDVFVLKVRPGLISPGFAMGIVLLLDQMFP